MFVLFDEAAIKKIKMIELNSDRKYLPEYTCSIR